MVHEHPLEHIREAETLLHLADEYMNGERGTLEEAATLAMRAQAHAAVALAIQARQGIRTTAYTVTP